MMRDRGAVTIAPAGTLVITTAFGPIRTPSPMVMPPTSMAPAPISTRLPSFGAGTFRTSTPGVARSWPRVTPWRIMQSSPIVELPCTVMPCWWPTAKRRPIRAVCGSSMP